MVYEAAFPSERAGPAGQTAEAAPPGRARDAAAHHKHPSPSLTVGSPGHPAEAEQLLLPAEHTPGRQSPDPEAAPSTPHARARQSSTSQLVRPAQPRLGPRRPPSGRGPASSPAGGPTAQERPRPRSAVPSAASLVGRSLARRLGSRRQAREHSHPSRLAKAGQTHLVSAILPPPSSSQAPGRGVGEGQAGTGGGSSCACATAAVRAGNRSLGDRSSEGPLGTAATETGQINTLFLKIYLFFFMTSVYSVSLQQVR